MNTSIEHLPPAKQQQLRSITTIIVQAIHPEKIILFGMSGLTGVPDLSGAGFPAFLEGYDLLIVTRRGDRRYEHEVQDLIENRCRPYPAVNILVHDIDHVNTRLSEGQYFFSLMSQDALLLYDAGKIPLVAASAPDLSRIRVAAQQDFEKWKNRARAFFNSALFNIGRQEWRVALFLLHQSAEQIYQAILLAYMGYKPCTHNLDKLRRYTNRLSIELALVFPRDTEKEDHIFRLLLQAYVDARYKDDFLVTEEESGLLTHRVAQLLSIAERVCQNRFTSLEKMARHH